MPSRRPARPPSERATWRAAAIATSIGLTLAILPLPAAARVPSVARDGSVPTAAADARRTAATTGGVPEGSPPPSTAAGRGARRPGSAVSILNPDCLNASDAVVRADELRANHYRLGSSPSVDLPADPRWTEDPLDDNAWQFRYHSMRYVLDLLTASRVTGDVAYRRRALELLEDWSRDNPRHRAPTAWAWNDHTTALRAVVLACTADQVPMTAWLRAALIVHGRTLADPAFYRRTGNHALNQAIALLEVARVLGRSDWRDLAGRRINALILASVDREGVTNEQSIGYADYNYRRYLVAAERMRAVGLRPDAAFARINLMPAFLAQATLPTGTYEMIGDTANWPAHAIAGTVAEYAATRGASGPKPTETIARYTAGYLFARSGWGERQPPADESFLSVRWGPAPVFHGHADGMSLTLAAHGSRLLVDPGMFGYNPGPVRAFFKGRPAHNIVTVDGAAWSTSAPTQLLGYRETADVVDVRLQAAGYPGVVHTRRITYSRALDYILVHDRLTSSTDHTYRQLWHLVEGSLPTTDETTLVTNRPKGNVLIRQLIGTSDVRVVEATLDPVQGWISYKTGHTVPAPVEQAVQRGRHVRYLTLIVPADGRPSVDVRDLVVTAAGYAVTISIGGRSERVTVSGPSVWVRALAPA